MEATKVITDKERNEAFRTLEQWANQQGTKRSLVVITTELQSEDLLAVGKSIHGQVIQLIGSIISVCADDASGDYIKIFRKGVECAQRVIDKKININPDNNDEPDSTMAQA